MSHPSALPQVAESKQLQRDTIQAQRDLHAGQLRQLERLVEQATARSTQLQGEATSLRTASQSAETRAAALEQENASLLSELAAAREAAATAQAAQAAAERNAQTAARKLESKAAAEAKAAQVRMHGAQGRGVAQWQLLLAQCLTGDSPDCPESLASRDRSSCHRSPPCLQREADLRQSLNEANKLLKAALKRADGAGRALDAKAKELAAAEAALAATVQAQEAQHRDRRAVVRPEQALAAIVTLSVLVVGTGAAVATLRKMQ